MENKSLSKNFIFYMMRTFVVAISPLIIFPYASRVLGTEGVGKVIYVQTIASYFQLFASFGFVSYGIRQGSAVRDDRQKLGQLASELLVLNLLTVAIALTAYLEVSFLPIFAPYHSLMAVFSLYIIFAGLNLDWFFHVTEDFFYITVRTFAGQAAAILILFLFLRSRADIMVYAIVIIVPYILIFAANLSGSLRKVTLFRNRKLEIGKHIYPAAMLFSIILASSIYSLLDTTMLGLMKGDSAVGLYSAASKISRLVIQLLTAMCTVFLPRLSFYAESGEKDKFRTLSLRACKIVSMAAIPCAAGLWTFRRQAILLFSGAEFLEAESAVAILAFNLFFSAFDGIMGWQVLVPNHREKVLLFATCLGAGADIILNFLMIPGMGVKGAALATLLSECLVFSVCVREAGRYLNIREVLSHLVLYAAASLPIPALSLFLKNLTSSLLTFVIAVPAAGILYLIILLLCREELVTMCMQKLKRRK